MHATISGDSRYLAHVLYDSPKVRNMVDSALERERGRLRDPIGVMRRDGLETMLDSRRNPYERLEDEMDKESGYEVPGGTRFRILFESGAVPYSKVELEDGNFKGRVGWLSRRSWYDRRTEWP
jgi:hypothetical protein